MAGAPKGNQNAAKAKVWSAAIKRALEARSKAEQRELMEAIANRLIDMCLEGDLQAIKEFGDRMEGKVPQGLEGTGDGGAFIVKWADA